MSTGGSCGTNDPWGWLGLLKWSLSYTDGTSENSDMKPMSKEDKEFLEKVMKDGIIDEGKRMQEILKNVTKQLEDWKTTGEGKTTSEETSNREEIERHVQEELEELRDIVEQIDYARAFCSVKGLQFLLGCIGENDGIIPRSTKYACFGIIATLCQHNPPVQAELLSLGSLKLFSDVYFTEMNQRSQQQQQEEQQEPSNHRSDETYKYCARIMQAISANVRSHETAEQVFFQLDQARELIESGLGMTTVMNTDNNNNNNNHQNQCFETLVKRTIFFLSALLTSDTCTIEQAQGIEYSFAYILDNYILPPGTATAEQQQQQQPQQSLSPQQQSQDGPCTELQEISIALLLRLVEQRKCLSVIVQRLNNIQTHANNRIQYITTSLQGDEREFATVELEYWGQLLPLLGEAVQQQETTTSSNPAPPLLGPSETLHLPQ